METLQLVLFTLIWTGFWVLPLRPLSPATEVVIGLIPFCAFGLRVFTGFFETVPPGDQIGDYVRPITDWVNGAGGPSYQLVLDGTVALGLVWFAQAFHIPLRSRIATAWIFPAVATASIATDSITGLSLPEYLAATLPTPILALVLALLLSALVWWTPGPHTLNTRRYAGLAIIGLIPSATILLVLVTPLIINVSPDQLAPVKSLLSLGAGSLTALLGYLLNPFQATRSRLLFALVVGVSVGAVSALHLSDAVR